MNLFQKQQKTSRYNSIPDASADEDTAVPIGTTILPPTWWMVAIVAGMMLLVAGCGAVWMLPDADDSCVPAVGTFSGTSTTTSDGKDNPFETCFQYGNYDKYCWTKSWFASDDDFGHGNWGGQWNSIDNDDMRYVNPVTDPYSCGSPCQGQHEDKSF